MERTGDGTARLVCEKQKDAEEFKDIHVRLEPVQLDDGTHTSQVVVPSDAVATRTPSLTGAALAVWNAACELGGDDISSRALREKSGVPRDTFYKALRGLCEKGRLVKTGKGKTAVYDLPGVSLLQSAATAT